MKSQATGREKNLVKHTSDRVVVSQVYTEFFKLKSKKTNNPIKKWAKDLNRHSSKDHRWRSSPGEGGARRHEALKSHTSRQQQAPGACPEKGCDVDTNVGEGGGGRTPTQCWRECSTEQPFLVTVWRFLQS